MSAGKLAGRGRLRLPILGRALLATGLAIGLMPVHGASPAHACSCVLGTEKTHYEWADVVFSGKLTKTRTGADRTKKSELTVYTFTPSRRYKGKVRTPQKVQTSSHGTACGLALSGDGPFLVYANRQRPADDTAAARTRAAEKPLLASSCGGTRRIKVGGQPPRSGQARRSESPDAGLLTRGQAATGRRSPADSRSTSPMCPARTARPPRTKT